MPITIKEINALETYGVRHPVLRAGRPLEDCALSGDDLNTTFHLGAFDDERHVGVATFLKSNAAESPIDSASHDSFYQLRGMGVIPDHQGKGIGKQLIEAGVEKLKVKEIQVLWFNARIAAVPFYEKLGFVTIGPTFEVENVGTHYKMYRIL